MTSDSKNEQYFFGLFYHFYRMVIDFRFGRLQVIVLGLLLNSVFGLIKSFSISYGMYIVVSESM